MLRLPSLVPHEAWSEAALNAFRETVINVLESEPGLVGWEERRNGFVRQMALRSGQPSASAERYVPPVLATLVDRAEWLGDLRLEGVIVGAMSAKRDLFGLIRLILSDVEGEDFSPAPHALAGRLIELALQRPEILVVLLFKVRWSPILLADLLLYPATSAMACSLIAQWPGPSGAWDRELRARDDQTTKAVAFADAVSVLGDFLEQGSIPPDEGAALVNVLHKSASPGFIDDLEKSESMLVTLRDELASQTSETLRAIFQALASSMPQSGVGTSQFASTLDILDVGKLAGSIAGAPLISAYIQSISAGEYALSAHRVSISGAASLVELAMTMAPDIRQSFYSPVDVASRIAAASAPDANFIAINDATARS